MSRKATAAARQPEAREFNIAEFCREAFERTGDMDKTTDLLAEAVRTDPQFVANKLPAILRKWCAAQVSMHVITLNRAAIFRPYSDNPPAAANNGAERDGARLRAVIDNHLMNYPLPGGKRLRDATGSEARAAATMYLDKSRDMGRKGQWLARVADKVGENSIVGKVLSESDLARLAEESDV